MLLLIFAHMGTKCARDEGEEGRKDAATGFSSLFHLTKVISSILATLDVTLGSKAHVL
jgi:hypothetical protein